MGYQYKPKNLPEIRVLVNKARKLGYHVRGVNGGGWVRLAFACGLEGDQTKESARRFLRMKLSEQTELQKPVALDPNADEFLSSYEWRVLRMRVLTKYGPVCMCCGATRKDGIVINVDHIKPRKRHPELALEFENLQVLCGPCNHGKSNWDETDWRQN